MKPIYGDDVALSRALRRYEDERRNITGSRVGAVGNVTVYSASSPNGTNGALYLSDLERKADDYFNSSSGTVNVGDLIPLDGNENELLDNQRDPAE